MAGKLAPGRLGSLPANPQKGTLLRAIWGSLPGPHRKRPLELEGRLEATYAWLCGAQDTTPDGGVAGWFDLFGGRWTPSYPETTGYIVPTLLQLSARLGDPGAGRTAALPPGRA